jgi:hypothetical protein
MVRQHGEFLQKRDIAHMHMRGHTQDGRREVQKGIL